MSKKPQLVEKIETIHDNLCSILITCRELPQKEGKMEVDLSYEGDPILASYLLENVQNYIDQDNFSS